MIVALYDFKPNNVVVPEVVGYSSDPKTSTIKQEINYTNGGDTTADENMESILTPLQSYNIDATKLTVYSQKNLYNSGNSNPFEYVQQVDSAEAQKGNSNISVAAVQKATKAREAVELDIANLVTEFNNAKNSNSQSGTQMASAGAYILSKRGTNYTLHGMSDYYVVAADGDKYKVTLTVVDDSGKSILTCQGAIDASGKWNPALVLPTANENSNTTQNPGTSGTGTFFEKPNSK